MGKKLQLLGLTLMHLEPLISKVLRNQLIVLYGHFYPGIDGCFEDDKIRSNLRYLRNHCAVFPLEEALRGLYSGTLPPRSVALVVDDATQSFYEHGWPLLAESKIPFTLAVIPGFIKNETQDHYLSSLMHLGGHLYHFKQAQPILKRAMDWLGKTPANEPDIESVFREARKLSLSDLAALVGYMEGSNTQPMQSMTWDKLKHLGETGKVTFASHSMSHSRFANVTGKWLQWELKRSTESIKEHLDTDVTTFVYPYGEKKNATSEVQKELENCQYKNAFLSAQGVIETRTSRYAMPRMKVEVEPRLMQLNSSPASCSLVYRTHFVNNASGS